MEATATCSEKEINGMKGSFIFWISFRWTTNEIWFVIWENQQVASAQVRCWQYCFHRTYKKNDCLGGFVDGKLSKEKCCYFITLSGYCSSWINFTTPETGYHQSILRTKPPHYFLYLPFITHGTEGPYLFLHDANVHRQVARSRGAECNGRRTRYLIERVKEQTFSRL